MARAPRPHTPRAGRRRAPRTRSARGATRLLLPLLGAATALAVAVTAVWVLGADESAGAPCPDAPRTLTVAAAPEIAAVLAAATGEGSASVLEGDADCLDVAVSATLPVEVASALRAGEPAPADVWVPDSSLWLTGLAAALPDADAVPIARSPVVLAVARGTAEAAGWPQRPLDPASLVTGEGATSRLGLPDPARSAAGSATLLALDAASADNPAGRTALTTALRAAVRPLPEDPAALLAELAGDVPLAVPVPEAAVWAHATRAEATPAVAAYPDGGPVLDYPLVVLAADAAAREDAATLRAALSGEAWTRHVQAAGFRGGDGSAGPQLDTDHGVDATQGSAAPVPDPAAVQAAVRVYEVVTRGTRMLAAIDVSGSMAAQVPGADGATRMELASDAAANGLALYADDAHIGLWVFSTGLTPTTDHRELAPIGPLGPQPDGVPGREKLARALADVDYVSDGDTGLYDTALAAVRAVRGGWDPERVNSVVLLTDGRNDDDNSISLDELLGALEQEAGDRPVPVIGIAYGPDSDSDALREISRVTGGTTYRVPDARRVHQVVADALAQRPCRPAC